jgi:hypothetical protein
MKLIEGTVTPALIAATRANAPSPLYWSPGNTSEI